MLQQYILKTILDKSININFIKQQHKLQMHMLIKIIY